MFEHSFMARFLLSLVLRFQLQRKLAYNDTQNLTFLFEPVLILSNSN